LQIAPHDLNLTLSYGIAQLCAGDPEEALSVLRRLSPTGKTQFYLGMAYRALRDHKAAQEAFSKAFGMGYEDPYVLYALIEQDRALRDKGAGLRDFRTFCERFPNSAWLHLLLADAYASRHDAANAETEYTQALNLNPNLPIVHFQLGRLALNRTAYSAAQEEFTKEMVLNPSFGEAYLYEGVTLRQQGKNREALPFLEEAVKRDPNSALPYRELSAAQVEANQLEAALRTLRVGEERFPHEAAFPAQLASLLKRVGRSQEAKKEAELAEALSRESNPGLPFLFDVAVAPQGPTAKAEATSVKADETEPSSFTAGSGLFQRPAPEDFEASDATTANVGATQHVNPALAQLLECLRRADAKCSTTALAQIRDPKLEDDPEYLDLAAQALSLQHRRVQALDAIRRAIEKDPKQARYFMTQGWIYQKFGDQVSAIRSFLNAERLEPRSPVPYYSLGVSFFAVGYFYSDPVYYARAEQRFKTALELDPLYDKAEFMLGVIDAVNSRLTEAKQHLEETLKMKPFNPIYHLHYGILLNRLGDNASSLREMKMAEELDPYYALTHLNLGSLYSRIRSYEEARNELEKAIELDPHLGSAYYLLGGVYHHLGLNDKSARAYEHFEQAKQRSRKDTTDALENTISSPGPGFAPEYR
jgi:tetratricopeptide (TPR) repeat protein